MRLCRVTLLGIVLSILIVPSALAFHEGAAVRAGMLLSLIHI